MPTTSSCHCCGEKSPEPMDDRYDGKLYKTCFECWVNQCHLPSNKEKRCWKRKKYARQTCLPTVGLSGVKALLAVKFAQLAAGDKADAAFKAALVEAGAAMDEASTVIAKLQHKAEVALHQTALYEADLAYKAADATSKAALAKAGAAWEAAKDEAEPETLDKTEAVIGEADAVYTAAIGKAEAKLRAALKESEATFKAAIVEAETLTARRDIAAAFQASWPKALDTYLADVARARVAYMAAIIEAMQTINHLLKT